MPASTSAEKIALDRVPGRKVPPGRRSVHRGRHRPRAGRRPAAATSWTSSPTPSGPPTGAATTTSPSRSSARCPASGTPCRPGWWSARAPAAPARRSAGTSGTSGTPPRSAWSTRRTRRSIPAYASGDWSVNTGRGSRIEGIGRPAGRSLVPAARRRPDVRRAGRGVAGRDAGRLRGARPPRRRLNGYEPVGRFQPDRGDAGGRRTRLGGDPALRRRRTLRTPRTTTTTWVAAAGLDLAPHLAVLDTFLASGEWRG